MMNSNLRDDLHEIVKKVVISAPIEKVWLAVSTPEGIAEWWMPGNIAAYAGKKFVLHSSQFGDSPCVVTESDPPNFLGFDWDEDWHLEFRLRDLGDGKTEFTLTHSGWKKGKRNRFGLIHDEIHSTMNEGWERIVSQDLVGYAEGRETP